MSRGEQLSMLKRARIEATSGRDHGHFSPQNDYTLFSGPCDHLLSEIGSGEIDLIVTSPPYNIGKTYERRTSLDAYLADQDRVIGLCEERLSKNGSICWQVGNHIIDGAVVPLDIVLYPLFKKRGLVLRNRIIWHFEHGLHCS